MGQKRDAEMSSKVLYGWNCPPKVHYIWVPDYYKAFETVMPLKGVILVEMAQVEISGEWYSIPECMGVVVDARYTGVIDTIVAALNEAFSDFDCGGGEDA